MPQLDLSSEEVEALFSVLQTDFSDLSMEIADTDSMDFREKLKSRREALGRILEKLKAARGAS